LSSKSSKIDLEAPSGKSSVAIGSIEKVHGIGGAFVVGIDPSMKHSIGVGTILQLHFGTQAAASVSDTPPERLSVASVRAEGPGIRVRCDEVRTREQAERLVGAVVRVDRGSLPDLSDSEYYDSDILGARVSTAAGVAVGILSDIIATGANDVYVIRRGDEGEVLVPAVAGSILSVDTEARRIVIDDRLIGNDSGNDDDGVGYDGGGSR